jgi:hypothetical protein
MSAKFISDAGSLLDAVVLPHAVIDVAVIAIASNNITFFFFMPFLPLCLYIVLFT